MPNPIIKIKRGTTTPLSLSTGELAVDLQNKNLFVGDAANLPLAIGGEGTYATKTYVDNAVSNLGAALHYVGDVSAATSNNLDTLSDTTTGAYYRVDVAGTYTASGGFSVSAKVGDAFVKTSTSWQKLDNVDAVVSGTDNEISVTGDENAGYTVAIASEFSTRVDDLETKTQNINLNDTDAGNTVITGNLSVSGNITDATIDGGVY